jgi:AbrB family looped-hinge helix DNA binding protein
MVKIEVRDMALTSTVSSKGQITVPAQLRDRLGLTPGSRVFFNIEAGADRIVMSKAVTLDERLDHIRKGFSRQTKDAIALHRGKTTDELRADYLQSDAGTEELRGMAYGKN